MALIHNIAPVVLNGLVLCLDAGNARSYPGSGSMWRNVAITNLNSYSNGNAIVRGTPTFTSLYGGAITTPANQTTTYVELPENVLQSLPSGLTWTMELILTIPNADQFASTRYGPHMTVAGGNDFIWQWNLTDCNLYGYSPATGSNPTWSVNVPFLLQLTRNADTWTVYKNGVQAASYTTTGMTNTTAIQGWILDQEEDGLKGAFDPNQNLNAHWHRVSLYNRILSSAELLQNYNALRGRFGI